MTTVLLIASLLSSTRKYSRQVLESAISLKNSGFIYCGMTFTDYNLCARALIAVSWSLLLGFLSGHS